MGVFELYCSFCAGPLCDARSAWLSYLVVARDAPWPPKDGEWRNPPGFPIPSKSKEDIVCITPEDGAFWNDWICVGPKWKDGWVSPPCEQGDYGEIFIDGSSDWQDGSQKYLRIHRGCLSFLCRRVAITPRDLWESLYQPGADYLRYGEQVQGLLYCLKYYDVDGRNGQEFGYAIARQTPREDEPDCVDRWDDPDSMDDTAWILTRLTCLPLPVALKAVSPPAAIPEPTSSADCMKIFSVPELLDLVLSAIVEVFPCDAATELMEDGAEFDPPSLVSATKALLALCQVNRFFHDAIIRDRQGLFLLLASQYRWMLPSTPGDWKERRERSGPELDLRLEQALDWRGYMLNFLRKGDRVVKNRWRMHRMSVQFARGRARLPTETTPAWSWSVGSLGLRSGIVSPDAWAWEL
ncbi:hypothetical protein DFH06DRAFT_1239912 [Mycena polygramma]|nr:hypothetical protein DFH06DRAFT_1239912 [Mycena polygramma]